MYFRRFFCALILFLVNTDATLGKIAHTKEGVPLVQLPNSGKLSGSVKSSREERLYDAFVGIPYATVPERFQPARLIDEAWEGTRESTTRGNICPQSPLGKPDEEMIGNEDCLNLNVYVPQVSKTDKKTKTKLPVMVWLHGGGFIFGDGIGYGPKFFMDEDVVLVTLNYRLSIFGFLSTGDGVIPGNNGLKDIVLALKWVQKNIEAFGGDADKVTIFGESAGGAAVHYLVLSPLAKGLFHRAISQSGSAMGLWAFQPRPRENAVKLAKYLKCPKAGDKPEDITSQEILDCFRGLSTEQLNKAQLSFKTSWPGNLFSLYFGPTAEPETTVDPFLTKSPVEIFSNNLPQNEVPYIIGATKDEGAYMLAGAILNNKNWTRELDTEWDTVAPVAFSSLEHHFSPSEMPGVLKKLRKFYFGEKPISEETRQNLSNLYSDWLNLHGIYKTAVESAKRWAGGPVYLYQYAYPGPISFLGMWLGIPVNYDETTIGHGDELLHQFNLTEEDVPSLEGHKTFSKNFIKLWTTFASTGKPEYSWGSDNSISKQWQPVPKENDGTSLQWYKIGSEPKMIENPYQERMAFWDNLLKRIA